MKLKFALIYLAAMLCCSMKGLALTPPNDPLPFSLWKKHQIVEAKNHVVRLSNRIHLLKTGRYKAEVIVSESVDPLLGEQVEKEYQSLKDFKEAKVDEETLKIAEAKVLKSVQERMKVALGNLQYAKELSIDDYLAVYLSRFKNNDDALKNVIKKLSDVEVLQILKSKMDDEKAKGRGVRNTSIISELQPAPPLPREEKNL